MRDCVICDWLIEYVDVDKLIDDDNALIKFETPYGVVLAVIP